MGYNFLKLAFFENLDSSHYFIRHKVYWSRDARDTRYRTAIGGSSGDVIQTRRKNIINYIY